MKEIQKRKAPQICKSPKQRQKFIIRNVTEKKKNQNLKSLIRFHSANKINNYNQVEIKEKKKKKKYPKESTEQVKT